MTSGRRYSLVVLTRNRPDSLARCLLSICALRWEGNRPEIIVVDDGSIPSVEPVARKFSSLNLVFVSQDHRGVSAARNRGISEAKGTHVGFIADDYEVPPTYLADVDSFFAGHPDAAMISHWIEPRGSSVLGPVQRLYFDLALAQELPESQVRQDVAESFTLPASRAAVFNRSVFERVGMFDESLKVGEDGEFGRRMARAGIPVNIFTRKRVVHHDARNALDYVRQRLRYGRSYLRAGTAGPTQRSLSRGTLRLAPGLVERLARKTAQWWVVAGRIRQRGRFIALFPFLVMFLLFFYLGAYRELRSIQREGGTV